MGIYKDRAKPDKTRDAVYRLAGERIAALRQQNGLTQVEMGRLLGASHTAICNMEGGLALRLVNLYKMAFAMDVDITDLLPTMDEVRAEMDKV